MQSKHARCWATVLIRQPSPPSQKLIFQRGVAMTKTMCVFKRGNRRLMIVVVIGWKVTSIDRLVREE
jgi:hypothetical protein